MLSYGYGDTYLNNIVNIPDGDRITEFNRRVLLICLG
jgi:hypothetical protein